jgi:alpha-1,3/alpha-1,6-mannosyltransferase
VADIILANSEFTVGIFKKYFPSIPTIPRVVYPGVNVSAYEDGADLQDPHVKAILS